MKGMGSLHRLLLTCVSGVELLGEQAASRFPNANLGSSQVLSRHLIWVNLVPRGELLLTSSSLDAFPLPETALRRRSVLAGLAQHTC